MNSKPKGFTLIELLIVMAIIGTLATFLINAIFRSAQQKSRDVQRKTELKQLAEALEIFYADHGAYPGDDLNGNILGCPYDPGAPVACIWGISEFTDGATSYFRVVPKDPIDDQSYYYRNPATLGVQAFQLFAHLEHPTDPDCLGGDCASPPVDYECGSEQCNFAITSPNVAAND